jgi:pimeloyl-ACP methyl ester carboxylesterase
MTTVKLPRRGMEIAYADAGAGQPIVFLHGFPFDQQMWEPQVRGLSSEYRVLTLDLPGFGQSSAPTEGFTVEALAEIVADFLDAIGLMGTVVLAGLSMGGYVALAFARQRPERLRGLILADTKAAPDDETAKANRDAMAELARKEGSAAVVDKLLPKLLGPATQANKAAVVDQVRAIGVCQQVPTIVMALQALRERPDATAGLGQITVPTLVIVGEHDAVTPPKEAKNLVDRILGATYAELPGVGHLSNLEDADAFNARVRDFLGHPMLG